jgi:hypothetical protein
MRTEPHLRVRVVDDAFKGHLKGAARGQKRAQKHPRLGACLLGATEFHGWVRDHEDRIDLTDSADFTQIRAPDIRRQVGEIYASNRFWPEFESVAQVQALGYSRVCAAAND